MTDPIRIGTRGSPLALYQAREVAARLAAAHPDLDRPDAVEIIVIRTTGDAVTDRTLAAIGGKGLFTKEIEEALLAGSIDLAVHSMKDVPTVLPDGLIIDCYLEREDPRDALISPLATSIETLPPGTVVGTASLRRQAQILSARPDLKVVPIRGNVDTRLRKLSEGVVGATLLALAGLRRLGLEAHVSGEIPPESLLPAVAQGAIGIERREDDPRIAAFLAPLDHGETRIRVETERALLAILDGSCRTPIAALAEIIDPTTMRLRGLIVRPDGSASHAFDGTAPLAEARWLGRRAGETLLREAGPEFLAEIIDRPEPDQPVA